jgi:anti-sigma regulatory factor (Ser/Thr protein kinase)
MPETLTKPPTGGAEDDCWLARSKRSPALARRLLRNLLATVKGGERFSERGELLLSELVTNAVLHGDSDGTLIYVKLAVTPGDRLRIEVHDRNDGPPLPGQAPADAESGRGLLLVKSLSQRWGCCPRGDGYFGKIVWCETSPEPEEG